MILCMGCATDPAFTHTLGALREAGVPFDALDLAHLARVGDLSIPSDAPLEATFTLHETRYMLGRYRSAFVRAFDLARSAPDARLRARAEGQYAALVELFSAPPLPVLNPPEAPYRGLSKLFHATAVAQRLGWPTPRSCLTNDPAAAREFVASCPAGAIFKGASTDKTYASLYDHNVHDSRLHLIRDCPVLFQERISGPNMRVYVIGDRVIGRHTESPALDHRLSTEQICSTVEVPPSIAERALRLSVLMETPMLAIDFKVQAETGTWFFLEANIMMQYRREDIQLDGLITGAVIAWLTRE